MLVGYVSDERYAVIADALPAFEADGLGLRVETHLHGGKLNLDACGTLIITTHPDYWIWKTDFQVKAWVRERGRRPMYLGGNGPHRRGRVPARRLANPDDGGGDMIHYRTPSGGAVFSTGSITWTCSILIDDAVSRITANVLRRFMTEASR